MNKNNPILLSKTKKEKQQLKRICMKKNIDKDTWTKIDMRKIKKGDVFELIEPDGAIVHDTHNNRFFIALKNAKKVKLGRGYASVVFISINDIQMSEIYRQIENDKFRDKRGY